MTLQAIEEYLFRRYKYYVEKQIKHKFAPNSYVILELQLMLNELFNYDFPHANGKYYAIKDEKIVYVYVPDVNRLRYE